MADEPSSTPGPFDVRTIRFLVALMSRHDLSEIDLSEGDRRIRLRRGPHGSVALAPSHPPVSHAPSHPTATVPVAPPAPPVPARRLIEIKSPGPGTFYAREKPEAAPYVTVGTRVTPTTVVGLIEAMKLFNEILAECNGVVAEILVENSQAIEYGQVLLRIDPAG